MRSLIFFIVFVCVVSCTALGPLRVDQVSFGGSIWGDNQRRAGVLFQDGAQSFPLGDGTGALWTFGDTFIGHPQPQGPPNNSQISGSVWATMAWLPAGITNLPPPLAYATGTNGIARCPLALFPDEDPKHLRLWPVDGISLGSQIYLYYSQIQISNAPGPWNFHALGGGLAVADAQARQFIRLRPGGKSLFPVTPIQIMKDGDTLLLYEISEEPKGLILARVHTDQIENPAAYEFRTEYGWSRHRIDVKIMLQGVHGQISIAWVPALGRYIMATSSDFYRPLEIQLRESRYPEGPWGEPVRIQVPETPDKKTKLVYCTFLHPELSNPQSPSLVATFCRSLAGNWDLTNPEWMVVTLGHGQR